MTGYSRRDLLRLGAGLASGLGLLDSQARVLAAGLDEILTGRTKVLWLQGMSCTGCSVSFLNADEPGPLEVLTELVSLVYHQTVSAAQGTDAVHVVDTLVKEGGYVLVVEGAVPVGMPEACTIGGKPFTTILASALRNAKAVVAAGTCAAFGGIPAAEGNLTQAAGVRAFMEKEGIPVKERLVNCAGCPMHPQALLSTIAYVAAKGYPPVHPELLTPDMVYKHSVHDECPRFHYWEKREFAEKFGDEGCLFNLGCLGPLSHGDCPRRQWNGGINWCVRAGAPCTACTSESFARRRDFPFYRFGERQHDVAYAEQDRKGGVL